MKIIIAGFTALLALALLSRADETLTFKTIEGLDYKNVTVTRVEPSGIQVMTDVGIDRVPFTSLPADLQKRFGFDPGAAAKFEAQVQAAKSTRLNAEAAANALRVARENATPAPTPKGTMLGKDGNKFGGAPDLPWPIEGHVFTVDEVTQYRKSLVGEVVKLALTASASDNEERPDGSVRVFASDAKTAGDAFVDFPPEAAKKLKVMEKSDGGLSFYVRVDKNRLTAVGRSRNIDSFSRTFTYTW